MEDGPQSIDNVNLEIPVQPRDAMISDIEDD